MSTPEKRIQELHLTLPPAPKPVAVYKTAVKFGTLLFVSGHGPLKADKTLEGMPLLAKGQRLSVQTVTPAHFARVLKLANAKTKG